MPLVDSISFDLCIALYGVESAYFCFGSYVQKPVTVFPFDGVSDVNICLNFFVVLPMNATVCTLLKLVLFFFWLLRCQIWFFRSVMSDFLLL